MHIFRSPSWPVLAQSSCNVKDFSQGLLNFFLQDYELFPRMKSSNSYLFGCPHFEMLDHTIQNYQIFIISFFEIVFDLIRIIALSHQAISNLIHLVVPILSHFFSNALNIDIVPVFLLVYQGKGWFQSIQLCPFQYCW